jgi:hypothetical protein
MSQCRWYSVINVNSNVAKISLYTIYNKIFSGDQPRRSGTIVQHFRGPLCLHHHGIIPSWWWRLRVPFWRGLWPEKILLHLAATKASSHIELYIFPLFHINNSSVVTSGIRISYNDVEKYHHHHMAGSTAQVEPWPTLFGVS